MLLCFYTGTDILYLEQVLVEQDHVPLLFICKGSLGRYAALCTGPDASHYIVAEIEGSMLCRLLQGQVPMRDVFTKAPWHWDIQAAGDMPQEHIVERQKSSSLDRSLLPEVGAVFQAYTEELLEYRKKVCGV